MERIQAHELMMHSCIRAFAPYIAIGGILLITNAAISGKSWLVPAIAIVATALAIAGIIILTSGTLKP